MVSPIEFKCRPYEDCLSDVVVTHSPRYAINMELMEGQTIFDKLNIPYDILRKSSNPVKPIMDYYRRFLKKGEEVWWLDQDETRSSNIIIKLWKNISFDDKRYYVLETMVLFPEIFTNRSDKYSRLGVWLINNYGVYKPNMRDGYSSGGQGEIIWRGVSYPGIPKTIINISKFANEISSIIINTDLEKLSYYWETDVTDKTVTWIDLIVKNTRYMRLPFDLREYLIEKMT